MNISPAIFRAYDIRGVVTDALTADVVREIGRAFGSEALAQDCQTVVIGRDGRLSGPSLIKALAEGLQSTGCDVIDIGMVPTPVLYFATHELGTGTGIMLTGSHNPPDYNGLKMMIAGNTLAGDTIQALRLRLDQQNLVAGKGEFSEQDISPRYRQRILSDVKLERELKVAVDCGNGIAGSMAPEVFQKLGCEIEGLYCDVDGNFPNHHPDPSKPENVAELIERVTSGGFDLGLAFDGDGDRLGVIDNLGRIIWADRQMILYARDVLSRNPGATIVYDVKCTRLLGPAIREAGGKPDMYKTGHSFIKARMKETGALLAGEMSGHLFFKERWYGFDDAIYAGARLLEILSKDSRSAAEIFDAIPNSINTPELNVHFENEGDNFAFIEKFAQRTFVGADVNTIDGLRADFADGWGLVRASNTTPSLVIRFEADDENALQRIQSLFRDAMQKTDSSVTLPFDLNT